MNSYRWLLCVCVCVSAWVVQAQPPFGRPLPKDVVAHRDLAYVEKGHARQRLDLYVPKDAKGPLPVIIWVHGGAWSAGDKANPQALFLVSKGYAVASINYRLSQHGVFPAQIEDCKAAVRWLRANAKKYNLDAERFGAWGASAGGHLVALLGTTGGVKELEGTGGNAEQSSRVQCVVDYFGPTDFTKMGGGWHDGPNAPEAKLIGGAVPKNKEKASRANPIRYVSKDAPPFLIVHGQRDPLVVANQSELLHAALKKAGVESELIIIPGAGHGGKEFNSAKMHQQVEQFFEKHLKKRS